MKKVLWHPQASKVIRSFSKEIKSEFGYLIRCLQKGEQLSMPHSRFHVFKKKTQKTPQKEIGLGKIHLKEAKEIIDG